MSLDYYEFDRNGDTVFILSHRKRYWSSKIKTSDKDSHKKLNYGFGLDATNSFIPGIHSLEWKSWTDENTIEKAETKIRVSRKHLMTASPMFTSMLEGPWKESTQLKDKGYCDLAIEDWLPDDFLILMSIFHGRSRMVPRAVDPNTFIRMLQLTDFYQCHEIMEIYLERWLDCLKRSFHHSYTDYTTAWIYISLIFDLDNEFKQTTLLYQKFGKSDVEILDLAVEPSIINKISQSRIELLEPLVHHIKTKSCSYYHSCYWNTLRSNSEIMEPPFEGLSFEELTSKILNTGEPPPLVPGVTYHDLRFMQDACAYSILDLIPKVKKLTAGIQGLDIMLLS